MEQAEFVTKMFILLMIMVLMGGLAPVGSLTDNVAVACDNPTCGGD
jgi:hypothetical protein